MQMWELEVRESVRQTLADYTAATDRFDLGALAACFGVEGVLEFTGGQEPLIGPEAIEAGLRKARWPGRLETVRKEGTRYLFDCAHNPDGCRALAAHLGELRPKGKVALLFGALADKDLGAMLAAFDGVVDRRVYAVPAMRRAPESGEAYAAHRPGTIARSVRDGLVRAKRAAGPEGLVVVAGSIFLVNEARAAVLGQKMDPPIAM